MSRRWVRCNAICRRKGKDACRSTGEQQISAGPDATAQTSSLPSPASRCTRCGDFGRSLHCFKIGFQRLGVPCPHLRGHVVAPKAVRMPTRAWVGTLGTQRFLVSITERPWQLWDVPGETLAETRYQGVGQAGRKSIHPHHDPSATAGDDFVPAKADGADDAACHGLHRPCALAAAPHPGLLGEQ